MKAIKVRPLGFGEPGVWIAKAILRLAGWHIRGERPQTEKCVFTCAPHISNWDLFLMFLTALALRLPVYFLMKDTAFVGPLGWLWRQMGGIPVNRRERGNLVETMAKWFARHDQMYLVIAPEGTRKETGYWKMGYYWIAKEARVPIVCAHCSYPRRETGVGGMHSVSGDIEADFEKIKQYYAEVMPEYLPALPPDAVPKKAVGQ